MGDLLYQFTEWLRTTPLVEFALWISSTPLSLVIQNNFWAIPIIQTLHILAITAGFAAVLMMSLRLLGLAGGHRTLTQTADRYMPWMWWSLAVLILTGLLLIIGEPVRELINPVFWIKIALVIAVILMSIWFLGKAHRDMPQWETVASKRSGIRAGAVGMVVLWCVTMAAGRWIAYAPT